MVNHSVPELFVKLNGRCFKLGQFKEHTADGNRLGISLLTLGCEAFELFLLGAEAVGEVTQTAALCATASYLLYYRTIGRLGASKAMALNITYTAWAIAFTVVLLRDLSVLNPLTLICAAVIVVCGILAATDFKELFCKKRE